MNLDNVGIAIFIDSYSGNDGIGILGNNKKVKVSSYRNLDSKVVWITNIKNEEILKNKNIKGNYFLNYDLEKLIYKIGLNNLGRIKITEELFSIFYNIILKINDKNDNINDKLISSNSLMEFNEKLFTSKNFNKINGFFKKDKKRNFVSSLKKSKDESEICLFEKNEVIFNRILELNVPVGNWKRLNQKTISGKNADWFIGLKQKHCFVVEANINIKNNELNLLIPQKLYNGKCLINDIEFELISKFADIKVTNLYINDKKEKLENIFTLNNKFDSGYMIGSISNDIIYNMFIEKIKKFEFLDINNWIDSFENTLLLKKCLVFSNYNIKVIGYGQRTYLLTYINNEEKDKIISLSKKLKLVYPVNIH